MTRNLQTELEEFDGVWPSAWRPNPGDVLVGTVKQYSTGAGAYGPVRTVIIEQDDGERVSVWLSSTVLLSKFQEKKPKVGERIGIKYCGKAPGKDYKMYGLIVDRDEPEVLDFTPIGGEDENSGDW